MDHQRFDDLTRLLATRPSRRATLRGLAGAAAALFGGRLAAPVAAQEDCPTTCQFSSDCCEGYFCFDGACDNVCHVEGERCYTGDVCCEGLTCVIDSSNGVDETGFLPGDCTLLVCGETGASCQFPADCCEGFGCFFADGAGTCAPAQCYADGETCVSDLECCGDSVCEESVCCVTYGQRCWSAIDCCGGVECVGFDTETDSPGYCGACDDAGWPCRGDASCCPGSVCVEGACVPAGGTCTQAGGSCDSDAECCAGLFCEQSGSSEPGGDGDDSVEESGEWLGTCQVACVSHNGDCTGAEDCCEGLICEAGRCIANTTPDGDEEAVDTGADDDSGGESSAGTTSGGEQVTTLPATGAAPASDGLPLSLLAGGAALGAAALTLSRHRTAEES